MQTSKRLFALSKIPQVDHNTPLVPTSAPKNYEQIVKLGYDFAAPDTTTTNNAGYSTGTPLPTKTEIDRHAYPFSLNERMTVELLGRRATAAFGLPVSTAVTGSTAAYKHVYTPLNPQLETNLPVYTYIEKEGEPANPADITDDRKLPAAGLASINWTSGTDDAYLNGVSDWQPSGRVITPSAVNFNTAGTNHVVLDSQAGETSLKSGQAVVSIFPQASLGGTATVVGCNFRNVSIGYNTGTNFDAGYVCPEYAITGDSNSGLVRGSAPSGNPEITLSFSLVKTILFAQNFDPISKLRAQSQFSISFNYIAGLMPGITGTAIPFSANFKFLKLSVGSITQGDENGTATYDIVATVQAVGTDYGFSLEVFNKIASYATIS